MQRLLSNIFPVANIRKHHFYEAFKNSSWNDYHWRCMTTAKFIFESAALETHGEERCLNLEKGVWTRCWSSWAHLSPPATAGIFLFTGVQPEKVRGHYLHGYYNTLPYTHIIHIIYLAHNSQSGAAPEQKLEGYLHAIKI